jgi:hypothetical protein
VRRLEISSPRLLFDSVDPVRDSAGEPADVLTNNESEQNPDYTVEIGSDARSDHTH